MSEHHNRLPSALPPSIPIFPRAEQTALPLVIESSFEQEACMNIHKEGYAVLNFLFQQGQLFFFAGSLHHRIKTIISANVDAVSATFIAYFG